MTALQMGVSGCGKSTMGAHLAEALGAPFLDGDSLHPRENVEKMAAGVPLDDDRRPWLEEIGRCFVSAGHQPIVVACSALKVRYRDIIRAQASQVRFIHLHGTPDALAERMTARPGHFMPTSLLRSQLQSLEPLSSTEIGIQLDIRDSPDELTRQAIGWLGVTGNSPARGDFVESRIVAV